MYCISLGQANTTSLHCRFKLIACPASTKAMGRWAYQVKCRAKNILHPADRQRERLPDTAACLVPVLIRPRRADTTDGRMINHFLSCSIPFRCGKKLRWLN